jgi:hypothetical protein
METMTTESPGKLAALAKCAHDGCTCTIESGEQFCSDYCAAQAGTEASLMAEGGCNCGHPECEHTTAVPAGVLTGLEIR